MGKYQEKRDRFQLYSKGVQTKTGDITMSALLLVGLLFSGISFRAHTENKIQDQVMRQAHIDKLIHAKPKARYTLQTLERGY